jgi:hypothetical protein
MTQVAETYKPCGAEKHALDLVEQKAAHTRMKRLRAAFNAAPSVLWSTTKIGAAEGFFRLPQK